MRVHISCLCFQNASLPKRGSWIPKVCRLLWEHAVGLGLSLKFPWVLERHLATSPHIAISCAPYRIQNPSGPQIHPKTHPESPPETKLRKKKAKKYENRIFSVPFFRILVSGGESGCVLGCVLRIRGGFVFCTGRRRSQHRKWPLTSQLGTLVLLYLTSLHN